MSSKKTKNPIKEAKLAVNILGIFVTVCFLGVLSGFYYWFNVYLDRGVSDDVSVWGTFGDFVGGTLNPLVSLFTLMIVCRAYLSQREELHDTKTALIESSQAQHEQVTLTKKQIEVGSLQGQIDILINKENYYRQKMIDSAERYRKFYGMTNSKRYEQGHFNPFNGNSLNGWDDIKKILPDLEQDVTETQRAHSEVLDELDKMQARIGDFSSSMRKLKSKPLQEPRTSNSRHLG
jgi:hypothetical protein